MAFFLPATASAANTSQTVRASSPDQADVEQRDNGAICASRIAMQHLHRMVARREHFGHFMKHYA